MRQSNEPGSSKGEGLVPLPGFSLPHFDLTDYEFDREQPWKIEDGTIVWRIQRKIDFDPCPENCSFSDCPNRDLLYKKGSRLAKYPFLRLGDEVQKIQITVPRWFWGIAPEVVEVKPSLPHPGISAAHHMTTAALGFVVRQLNKWDASPEKIAESIGVTSRTIYRIKEEFILPSPWPVTLCINPAMECFQIDDVGIGKKSYTLLRDKTHNTFIGLIEGTSREEVGPALEAIRARCKILRATMDFGDYIPIVKAYFPEITITGDKFHLIQRLQKIMDDARRSSVFELESQERTSLQIWLNNCADEIGEKRKRSLSKLATKSGVADSLEEDCRLFRTKFNNLKTRHDKLKVRGWLKQIPALRIPYIFLQRMYVLLNKEDLDPSEARETFWEIVDLLRRKAPMQYEAAESFFRNHRREFEAYFDTGEDNSRAEASIRQIRDMLRLSRGLTYQELVRRLILRYAAGVPQCPPGIPEGPVSQRVKACTDEGRSVDTRHGKHARKQYPLDDPTPQGELSFDPQGDLPLE